MLDLQAQPDLLGRKGRATVLSDQRGHKDQRGRRVLKVLKVRQGDRRATKATLEHKAPQVLRNSPLHILRHRLQIEQHYSRRQQPFSRRRL